MADEPTAVYDLAAAVLAAIEAAYADADIVLPDRRYVAEGPPAYDCEQVVVAFSRLYPALPFREDPGAPVLRATLLRSVTLAVHVVRCIPTPTRQGNPPNVEALEASAVRILTDAYMLPTSVVKAWRAGDLGGVCNEFGVSQVVAADPSGGFGGMIMTIDAQF